MAKIIVVTKSGKQTEVGFNDIRNLSKNLTGLNIQAIVIPPVKKPVKK